MNRYQCAECNLFIKVLFSNNLINLETKDTWYECPKCLAKTLENLPSHIRQVNEVQS